MTVWNVTASTLDRATVWTARIAMVGILVNGAEWLSRWRANVRFFRWDLLQTRLPRSGAALERLGGERVFAAGVVVGMVASVGASLPITHDELALAALAIATIGSLSFLHLRCSFGFDGSDQMQVIVWSGLAAYHLAGGHVARVLAVDFIALQFVLAYATAGLAKLISPTWRRGRALALILRTDSYGSARLAALMQPRRLGLVLCWSTILLEVLGPMLIVPGGDFPLIFVAAAVAFHVSIALFMGLNLFVWAFCAALPCVLVLAQQMSMR
jgi:hypothetical protein